MSLLEKSDLTHAVVLKKISLDDISSVRYVHATSFRILAAEHHSEEEIEAHVDLINQPDYVDELFSCDVYVAWLDQEIVGTAGWLAADDSGTTARIRKVFVRPLFTSCGIGRLLVAHAEARAIKAGFRDFSVRANVNSIPFYERIGYEITSHGVMPTRSGIDLRVAFMRKNNIGDEKLLKRRLDHHPNLVTHGAYWNHPTEH